MQASVAPRSAFEGMTGEHADFKVPQEEFMDRKKNDLRGVPQFNPSRWQSE